MKDTVELCSLIYEDIDECVNLFIHFLVKIGMTCMNLFKKHMNSLVIILK